MIYKKSEVVEQYRLHVVDTGSTEIQIALLTTRINYLSNHFKKSPKDFASRVGFLKMIGKRRRLLNYIKKHNATRYFSILKKLNLRK
ncbi:MAG: 30S ribosomal protein S15 [Endomicrobium sp.]|jgi:small subunit ribosomal protein S15|nr:30S ribosomal protein S15 [Endomicrobium sp.]